MALAGVACASQTTLENAITLSQYAVGDSFELSFKIQYTNSSGGSATQFKMAENWYFFVQGAGGGGYAGLTSTSGAMSGAAYPDAEGGSSQWGASELDTNNVRTYVSDNGFYYGWISKKPSDAITVGMGSASKINETTITLSYDGEKHTAAFKMDRDDTNGDIVVNMSNVTLNANDFEFVSSSIYNATISFGSTPVIPEPATATLSLLALAGLAMRRRRK